jgi:hypothetical protein
MQPLLGTHKASAEWYTPDFIWEKVNAVLEYPVDPCPIMSKRDGLTYDWYSIVNPVCDSIYVNPPTPAAPWAEKAIRTHREHPEVNIIFAAFSINVLTQVNELLDFPVCYVRKRIKWIDGRPGKDSTSPSHYSAFVLLSSDSEVIERFKVNFSGLGNVRRSYVI